ncbi:MAG: carboxylating nicotinate-nucleotide diphosphorylase [Candidatus Jordarchaeum sp.]|uniref:carboxylating nicotinate-nucleotide diphosphorylase n=1 Tax=Candidatus Jordarchaeum sp. TaxID=2823881 RepID=UPI0040493AF7
MENLLKKKLLEFLEEDIGFGDITTNALISEDTVAEARIISKKEGVVAGLCEAGIIFELLNVNFEPLAKDGDRVTNGQTLAELSGSARVILSAERTVLNIMMRMSGIATETAKLVDLAKRINPKLRIACTRKTTPGFRYFEKRAVALGGGDPHRFRLDDMILIKDNHLSIVGSVREAVNQARSKSSFSKKIEIEVEDVDQAIEAASAGANIIMFDNMSPEEAKKALSLLEERGLRDRVLIELSGGITPENIEKYMVLDVDIISMGYIIHSIKALDLSLDFKKKS